MSVLTTHRFTVEEYHRLADTGLLKPDARVELLDGQPKSRFALNFQLDDANSSY